MKCVIGLQLNTGLSGGQEAIILKINANVHQWKTKYGHAAQLQQMQWKGKTRIVKQTVPIIKVY